jgi:hypothetical protein
MVRTLIAVLVLCACVGDELARDTAATEVADAAPPPCVHGGCDDGNPCTDDACDPAVGCVHAPHARACDDGDPGTAAAWCDPATARCVGRPATCPAPEAFDPGIQACVCPAEHRRCGGCVDTSSDRFHCGACGRQCQSQLGCVAGACACAPGETLCGAVCADLATSRDDCGACGTVCLGAQVCVGGRCR